ncbi:hypothetical protein ACFWFF_03870 [Streptomyces sp. NPDC060223]|uniref:hypothetical protein n=1 Tax=unclassified Streptomyces TaxID=2593676 RepID=UPI00362BAD3E
MADSPPGPQPRKVLTKPRPALSEQQEDALWKRRAQDVIKENLRKTSRWRALWNYLKRLWSPRKESGSPAGEGGSQEPSAGLSGPAGGDAPAAERPADRAEQRKRKFSMADVAELSIKDAEKLTAQLLDLIVKSPRLRDAYANRQLPVLEMLLEKTDPKNAEPPAPKEPEQPAPKEDAESVRSRRSSMSVAELYERGPVEGGADLRATLATEMDLSLATESRLPAGDIAHEPPTFLSGETVVDAPFASPVRDSQKFLDRYGSALTRTKSMGGEGSQEPVSPVSDLSRAGSPAPSQKSR